MYTIIRRKHNNAIVAGGLTADINFAKYENDDCELLDCYYLECFDTWSGQPNLNSRPYIPGSISKPNQPEDHHPCQTRR